MSATDYLAMERHAGIRTEWLDGAVYAVAGGSHLHWLIASNVAGELRHRLKNSDAVALNCGMRLKVEATGLYAYPDAQVVQGPPAFEDDRQDSLLNPKILFEVLSDLTAAWDRGGKFWHYRHLESLTEYVLISQETWLADHYVRQSNGSWMLKTVEGEDGTIQLTSVKCQLPLSEIYAHTTVPPGTALPSQSRPQPKVKA